jgi:hypothetical protein
LVVAHCAPFDQEGIVFRRHLIGFRFSIGIAAALLAALQISPVARSQDPPPTQTTTQSQTAPPPSLGDLAKKYREEKAAQDKNQATPKNTFTNEGLVSGKSGSLLGSDVANVAANRGSEPATAFTKALANIDDAIQKLDALGAMDHDTLFKTATQGIIVDFPGRKDWENQMIVARQNYVVHGRELLQSTKALFMDAKALHDAQPNLPATDPRVTSFTTKIQAKMADAQRMEAEFKMVVDEGHDRALKAAGY